METEKELIAKPQEPGPSSSLSHEPGPSSSLSVSTGEALEASPVTSIGARKQAKAERKQQKAKRRGGVLRGAPLMTKTVTIIIVLIACAALAFTQLGFWGVGWNGEYSAYLILELLPVAVAALLLGPLCGMCVGAFAGTMLLLHSTLMPLNYYELTFVTPLTSVVMMTVTGLILGFMFKFALRNDPGPVKSAIYIAIVCLIMSLLYSAGFVINAAISMTVTLAENTLGLDTEEVSRLINERASTFVLRMGNVNLQIVVDAALMALCCIITIAAIDRIKRSRENMGLRSMFAVRLTLVVFVAFMVTSAVSFAAITRGELADTETSMASEITYLKNQIDNSSKRLDTIVSFLSDEAIEKLLSSDEHADNLDAYSISSILDGYSSENDGIILILAPTASFSEEDRAQYDGVYVIVSSDDERFENGEMLEKVAGEEIVEAIDLSVAENSVKRAVYDQDHGKTLAQLAEAKVETVRSEIVYVLAQEKDDYVVTIMTPARKVFADRVGVMGWAAISVFMLLASVFAMVFLLLDRVVARRIDETNGVLARITAGDLNATVDVRNPQEFASLSHGVNETVDALKGWIAEAESRIDAELATAKAIQKSALPSIFPPFPDIARFDVYASMKAAREVGGDFYDFFLIGDDCNADSGKLGFIIADVSGKGVPASLFMMKSMTQLRDYMKVGMEIGEAVENANRQLCEGNDEGMFVTAWVGILDYATGHVEYVNAGHNPPLLWQQGSWRWLHEKSGLPLGLFDGLPYEAFSIECGIGDQFLLYTDGVTEAMSVEGELYGEDRLMALADENYTQHPRMLVNALRQDIAIWAKGAEQSDDITMLSLEVGVPPEITAVLKLPAKTENLSVVNEFIHSELDRRLCPKRVQNQLDIAVEELFVNVCHYAYPDATPEKPGTVRVQRAYSADPPCVVVDIIDGGVPYNPLAKPDAVTPDDIADVPIGGLGILMAKKCTDEMSYEYVGGNNIITIVKKW